MDKKKTIFVLAPHTDDGELGLGGTLAKLVEMGKDIYYIAFSCPPTDLGENALIDELKSATKVLGISQSNLIVYDFPVRNFSSNRQKILDKLVELRKEYKPDLVFLPSPHDLHQDHKTLSEEGIRAFKKDSILGYEMPWNNIIFQTQCFSVLKERHVEKKIEALLSYNSQMYRSYLNADFIKGLAKARGVQIQEDYAEAFEVIRWKI